MNEIAVGDRRYRLRANTRDGRWFARAEEVETGRLFGIECSGATEDEVHVLLTRWLEWQHEHAAALEALQAAERAYYRIVTGSAFSGLTEGGDAADMQKDSLEAVQAARARLDDIRAAKPL